MVSQRLRPIAGRQISIAKLLNLIFQRVRPRLSFGAQFLQFDHVVCNFGEPPQACAWLRVLQLLDQTSHCSEAIPRPIRPRTRVLRSLLVTQSHRATISFHELAVNCALFTSDVRGASPPPLHLGELGQPRHSSVIAVFPLRSPDPCMSAQHAKAAKAQSSFPNSAAARTVRVMLLRS